jgi:hypothetical protein
MLDEWEVYSYVVIHSLLHQILYLITYGILCHYGIFNSDTSYKLILTSTIVDDWILMKSMSISKTKFGISCINELF